MKEGLALMAKAPIEGQVKTRLTAVLEPAEAVELYANFLRDTFFLMEVLQDERETLSLILCYSPEGEEEAFENIEREGSLMLPQRGHDLGERLVNCFSDLFDFGFESIVVMGGDSPTLPVEFLEVAFDRLAEGADVVLGPSADDGYYLIGMRRLHAELFRDIPWSSPGVLEATRKRAASAGIRIFELPLWYDVDTPGQLERLKAELSEDPTPARRTAKFLRELAKNVKSN
ncbi:MAG: TIGR04282 family arsenosugar biosynthesis glycosyltransferase [Acidobacteriota bacterium]|nr:MAG: TIGR04282 family arsenosugar biosynthesis glycosyltransferase [Acidobacteriota bacterium]